MTRITNEAEAFLPTEFGQFRLVGFSPDLAGREHVAIVKGDLDGAEAVPIRIHFTAQWASYVSEREWHASQATEALPDGGLELTMEVGGSQELANWVLSFGGGATVLEPASLRTEVRASLKAALANYD